MKSIETSMIASCRGLLIGAMVFAAAASSVRADEGHRLAIPLLPQYQQECGACHLAYPPGLLPAASWQHLMAGLNHHFGSDASLDAPNTQAVTGWLVANAGTYKKVREAPVQDRISRAEWFVREHREITSAVWQRTSIKSASNCQACHGKADIGSFREREIRIPQ